MEIVRVQEEKAHFYCFRVGWVKWAWLKLVFWCCNWYL